MSWRSLREIPHPSFFSPVQPRQNINSSLILLYGVWMVTTKGTANTCRRQREQARRTHHWHMRKFTRRTTYVHMARYFFVCLFPLLCLVCLLMFSTFFFLFKHQEEKNQLKLCLMRSQQHTRYNLSNFACVAIKAQDAFEMMRRCFATASYMDTHQTNDAHSHFMYARTD